jgi:hypothetical protein
MTPFKAKICVDRGMTMERGGCEWGGGGRKDGRRRRQTAVVPREEAAKMYKKSMGPAR